MFMLTIVLSSRVFSVVVYVDDASVATFYLGAFGDRYQIVVAVLGAHPRDTVPLSESVLLTR